MDQLKETFKVEPISAVEVWSLSACPRCVEAKNRLRAAGVEVIERELREIIQAQPKAMAVALLTQSAMQGDAAPLMRVVRADGGRCDEFIEPGDLEAWLNGDCGEA